MSWSRYSLDLKTSLRPRLPNPFTDEHLVFQPEPDHDKAALVCAHVHVPPTGGVWSGLRAVSYPPDSLVTSV